MKAILRNVRIAPKKVNLVAMLVRKKPVEEALAILKFLPKASAKPLRQVIQSAAANATQNYKQKRESLVISSIVVNEAQTLKRWNPVSRGRAHPILKRMSHIRVEVRVKRSEPAGRSETSQEKTKQPTKKPVAAAKKDKAPTEKSTSKKSK